MFEGIRLISALKKLTKDTSNIPTQLIMSYETDIKNGLSSIDLASVMLLSTALNLGNTEEIALTPLGRQKLEGYKKMMSGND